MLAATFYMPMHEAVHKNIWGKVSSGRVVEEIIGTLCIHPTDAQTASSGNGARKSGKC
jgi:hypothetical protein